MEFKNQIRVWFSVKSAVKETVNSMEHVQEFHLRSPNPDLLCHVILPIPALSHPKLTAD
jgi:hypothetical protein